MKTSVVMCTYNGERYLAQQLESFVNQSRLPDELIVSDDRSSDKTWEILSDFAKNAPFDVRLKQNEHNHGVTGNFETALALARGDIIFLSDQDDVWDADKLWLIREKFESDYAIGMVFTDAEVVDDALASMNETLWNSWNITAAERRHFDVAPFDFLVTNRNIVTGAAAAFSQAVVRASLPFPKQMAILHDAWLAIIASDISKVIALPECLLKYRQHAAQLTGVRKARPEIGQQHYELHLAQLSALASRLDEIEGGKASKNRALVDGYLAHLQARLTLPQSPVGRVLPVTAELITGRYNRYSSGLRSAAKDLLRGR